MNLSLSLSLSLFSSPAHPPSYQFRPFVWFEFIQIIEGFDWSIGDNDVQTSVGYHQIGYDSTGSQR